ncbi:transcriptional regulator family: Grainyhead/CP2 [Penicillium cataractarum]|uniref:Transcriptional regulator family: Grainyhead/CP2 n=1 Tax=Penicillium cataractarum TaxID=2100454 RepID=A0A9W9VET9_9EURO|nr:transcriptional regulator family: Grainyhead/CP2 [Penicillium cataractarum]KAJ5378189.1 transcriptional regulator family: Grainyhead/CP2 [Penicillium cataractarum]
MFSNRQREWTCILTKLYQSALKYSGKDIDRSISPKNMFGNESLQFTRGWLPSSQSNWKIDPSSFEHPLPLQQQNHAGLFSNNLACEQSQILHCDSGYETWDEPAHSLSQGGFSRPQSSESALKSTSPQSFSATGTTISQAEGERFRFHTSLRASTAMVGDSKEAPESYLNKGQVYHLRLVDTTPPRLITEKTRYRTFVRVSFKEHKQRVNAEAYWQLWKDSRGLAESDTKDSELRAVEYAGQDSPQVQLEQEFLDGFSVTWTVNPATGLGECNIPVRFNFLSTDFTLAKGVKGISVRLCTKTDQLNNLEAPYQPEICFCNIRVFRDHGAERKLSNDITNIQKRIQKLTEQIGKTVLHEPPKKRKRGSVAAKNRNELKVSDQADHGSSMDTVDHAAGDPHSNKLQIKLTNLRTMLFSSCSESVLSLRGGKEDDPEVHVTRLQSRSPGPQNNAAPRVSSIRGSTASVDGALGSVRQGFNNVDAIEDGFPMTLKHAGPRQSPMPVACFYIHRSGEDSPSDRYYRTIYLRERSTRDLVQRICEKCSVDASKVSRILHTNQAGLEILVDDDFVEQIMEGQDMVVRIERLPLKDGGAGSPPSASLGIRLEY